MDNETFERAARSYGDMLYRVAFHAVGNRPDAEDVVQTALLRLYEHKGAFESDEHLKHWLLRVAVYLYYYEGCSVKEAAAVMGARASTVQTWLARAREKLRTALGDEKEGEYV